jgi:hypothetical protein
LNFIEFLLYNKIIFYYNMENENEYGHDVLSENEESPQEDVVEEKKPSYRQRNMERARLARLEKLKNKKEIKARQPKKVLEYNIESESDEESESDDDIVLSKRPPRRAPAKAKRIPPPPKLKRQMGYYEQPQYDQRDLALLQMQMQMQQLQHKVKRTAKKPVKKQTVVQVLQPSTQHISGSGSSNPMLDALLGK